MRRRDAVSFKTHLRRGRRDCRKVEDAKVGWIFSWPFSGLTWVRGLDCETGGRGETGVKGRARTP